MYTLIDIIDKFIEIEDIASVFYEDIGKSINKEYSNIKILSKVFSTEEVKHKNYYEQIRTKYINEKDIIIDFHSYDKISKLIIDFKNRKREFSSENVVNLLEEALNFEKDNLALLLTIQGKLINTEGDEKTTTYKALSSIIQEENKHVEEISQLLLNIKKS